MKKILLLIPFIIAGCVSVNDKSNTVTTEQIAIPACTNNYEDVAGYKIGCPLNTHGMTQKPSKTKGVQVFTAKLSDSFFDTAEFKILDGKLEELLFTKIYAPTTSAINSDMKALVKTLKERWGDYKLLNFGSRTKTAAYSFRNPKSKVLYNVMATQMYDASVGLISVDYTSKEMNRYLDSIEKQKNEQRSARLEGL